VFNSSGAVTLNADQAVVQHRVNGSCWAGSALTSVAIDGATVQLFHVAPSGVTLSPGSTLELTRLGS
jgi:hypothetical protein